MQLHAPNPTPADNELDQLYRRYAPVMYRAAFQILGEHAAAEDVVSEVILRLVKARRRPLRPGRNYFIKAARNEALHTLKRSESWSGLVGAFNSMAHDRDVGPEIDLELAEEREIARDLINGLPPRCCEVIELVVYGGLTQREIAERLGISIKAVQKQVTRGSRLLSQAAAKLGFKAQRTPVLKNGRGGEDKLGGLVKHKHSRQSKYGGWLGHDQGSTVKTSAFGLYSQGKEFEK